MTTTMTTRRRWRRRRTRTVQSCTAPGREESLINKEQEIQWRQRRQRRQRGGGGWGQGQCNPAPTSMVALILFYFVQKKIVFCAKNVGVFAMWKFSVVWIWWNFYMDLANSRIIMNFVTCWGQADVTWSSFKSKTNLIHLHTFDQFQG